MQIEHLRYLLDVYNARSISAAAHSLHIAQTTLSAAVKAVEESLGFPVFKRTPSGVVPTERGEIVLDLAWKVTSRYESLMGLKDRTDKPPRFFNILVSPALPPSILSKIAERYAQFRFPCNICFEERVSKEIGAEIAGQTAGIGIAVLTKTQYAVLQNYSPQVLNIVKLYDDEMRCITAANSPLGTKDAVTTTDLQQLHLVLPDAPLDPASIVAGISSYLTDYSVLPDISLLLAGVAHHGFTSVLPYKTIEQDIFIRSGECTAIPIKGKCYDVSVCVCLCSRPFDRLSRQEQFAYSCIRDIGEKKDEGGGRA